MRSDDWIRDLPGLLPSEVSCNEMLMNLCHAPSPDPNRRFPNAPLRRLWSQALRSSTANW